ncbi:MAG: glycosyltransferase family 9 protein [Candidatus Krumholzibacteria bacterium]|nr:glycosyltransferase family 9 protein [Candidatus Krumholzibacteria bacterium]
MNNPAENRSCLRLLVLAPNWLGDVVMHTPLLSLLHGYRGEVTAVTGRQVSIHLGVRRAWADLFRDDFRVDELILLERDRRHRGLAGTFRLANILRQGGYDAILLGPPSLRTGIAAWMSRIPCRVGYRSDGRSAFLTVGLSPEPRGSLHYSSEMIGLGRAWLDSLGVGIIESLDKGVPTSLPGCDSLPPADMGAGLPVWSVAPGTTYGEAKTWPVDRMGDFLELAIEKAGVRIVLLGDEAARGFTLRLRERFKEFWSEDPLGGTAILDLTGKTDLLTAAGILRSSSAFIGNDSGLMHLAAALGRPTVGVFGSSNPEWTAPLGRHAKAIVPTGFSCRPCYLKTCNQAEFCLDTVSAETVLAAVLDIAGDARTLREES